MSAIWVLGGRGLLGSALLRALRSEGSSPFEPAEPLSWTDPPDLELQLARAVRAFARRAGEAGRWEIYWAAGVSSMGTPPEASAKETAALSLLLDLWSAEPGLAGVPGSVAFASSAGAIYAGSTDVIVTEQSLPAPTTAYARAKLAQEELVRSFAASRGGVHALLARFATLYGPGQSHGKAQGLLAHMARCLIQNRSMHIYVPLDTVRDYLASDDAAAAMIAALRATPAARASGGAHVEIIASERPTTIAEIVAGFRRISRRSPRIIASANRLSTLYPRQVRFRSVARPEAPRPARISLLVGIHGVLRSEREAFASGGYRSPPVDG